LVSDWSSDVCSSDLVRFLGVFEAGSVGMSPIAVSGEAGIHTKPYPLGLGAIGDESGIPRIVDVVAAIENDGEVLLRLKQRPEIRHGPVVQVRRSRPDAVSRHVGV